MRVETYSQPDWQVDRSRISDRKPADVCLIVEGAPICLGSGWLLVLVPVLVLGWILAARRRRHPRVASEGA